MVDIIIRNGEIEGYHTEHGFRLAPLSEVELSYAKFLPDGVVRGRMMKAVHDNGLTINNRSVSLKSAKPRRVWLACDRTFRTLDDEGNKRTVESSQFARITRDGIEIFCRPCYSD